MNEQKLAQMRAMSRVDEKKLADAQDKNLLAAKKATLQYNALDYGFFKKLIKYNVQANDIFKQENKYIAEDLQDLAAFHQADNGKIQKFHQSNACSNLRQNQQRKLTSPVLEKIVRDFSEIHDKQ